MRPSRLVLGLPSRQDCLQTFLRSEFISQEGLLKWWKSVQRPQRLKVRGNRSGHALNKGFFYVSGVCVSQVPFGSEVRCSCKIIFSPVSSCHALGQKLTIQLVLWGHAHPCALTLRVQKSLPLIKPQSSFAVSRPFHCALYVGGCAGERNL